MLAVLALTASVYAADSNTTVPTKRPPDEQLAQAIWTQSCAECHGALGLGDGVLAPELGGVESLKGRITADSMNQLVDLVRAGKDKMPGYSETIDVGDTRRILEWMRDVSSGKIKPKVETAKPAKGKPASEDEAGGEGRADVKAEEADEE